MYFLLEKVPLKLIYFYMRKSLSLSSLDVIIYCGAKFYMLVRRSSGTFSYSARIPKSMDGH